MGAASVQEHLDYYSLISMCCDLGDAVFADACAEYVRSELPQYRTVPRFWKPSGKPIISQRALEDYWRKRGLLPIWMLQMS